MKASSMKGTERHNVCKGAKTDTKRASFFYLPVNCVLLKPL